MFSNAATFYRHFFAATFYRHLRRKAVVSALSDPGLNVSTISGTCHPAFAKRFNTWQSTRTLANIYQVEHFNERLVSRVGYTDKSFLHIDAESPVGNANLIQLF